MSFGDALAHGKTDACARVFGCDVAAFENRKDALEIFRIDADAVIPYRKDPLGRALGCGNVNARRLGAVKLDGVADQVLQQLTQLRLVGNDGG